MNKSEFTAIPDEDRFRTLEGTAFFAHVQSPDMQSAKRFNSTPEYHLSLGLDDEGVKLAKSYGLTVKDANDYIPMPFVKIKRKVKDTSDPQASKPDIVDSQQRAVPDDILIGNGSKVGVKFATYWYDQFGGGVGAALLKVQVLDLKKYEGGANTHDTDLVMDDGGWTVDSEGGHEDASLFDAATA